MKKYLILVLLALGACQKDDDPNPITQDPFVGPWRFSNSELDLKINFDVRRGNDKYVFPHIYVEHPDLPKNTAIEYKMEVHDQFEDNKGFGEIKIFASTETFWMIFIMTHNEIILDTDGYVLKSREIAVNAMNRLPIELENQEFQKLD